MKFIFMCLYVSLCVFNNSEVYSEENFYEDPLDLREMNEPEVPGHGGSSDIDDLLCDILGCGKAKAESVGDGAATDYSVTKAAAQRDALYIAIKRACRKAQSEAEKNLKCDSSDTCELFGVIEFAPASCLNFALDQKKKDTDEELNDSENIIVTDGSRQAFMKSCVTIKGYDHKGCAYLWTKDFHYIASATAEVTVTATQLCKTKENANSCSATNR